MKNKPKEAKGFVHRPRAEYKTVLLPDKVARAVVMRRIALIREANGLFPQEV